MNFIRRMKSEKWKVKIFTIEINEEIFYFSLSILGIKFHDWFQDIFHIFQLILLFV